MPSYQYPEPLEDDYSAVSEQGFLDDEHYADELQEPIFALPHAGFFQGLSRFYRFYWRKDGTASTAELIWGLLWVIGGLIFLYGSAYYLYTTVQNNTANGLMRTLYMLEIALNSLWVIVHIAPTFSLIRRFSNKK